MSTLWRKNEFNMITFLEEIWEYENYIKWRKKKRAIKYKEKINLKNKEKWEISKQKTIESKNALKDKISTLKSEWKKPLDIFNDFSKLVSLLKIKRIYNEV
jgi:hypothetical protein